MSDGITDARKEKRLEKRIMICGASGTGKTTLAKHISELYDLPYISISAKKIWERYGWETHQQALTASLGNPDHGLEYQLDLLDFRRNTFDPMERYVTDRSYIDNAAYLTLQMAYFLRKEDHLRLLTKVLAGMDKVDGLIFLRWSKEIKLEDDGKRVMNPIYHEMVDVIMNWFLEARYASCPVLQLKMWDFETRVIKVDEWVKRL